MRQKCSRSIPQSPMPGCFASVGETFDSFQARLPPASQNTNISFPQLFHRWPLAALLRNSPSPKKFLKLSQKSWSTYQLAGAPGRPPPTASCGRPARGHRPRWRWQLCCSSSLFRRRCGPVAATACVVPPWLRCFRFRRRLRRSRDSFD